MSFGFGLAFPRYILAAKGFSPASLFSSGEQGAWYDPSDINLTWRRNLLTYTEQFDNAAWVKSDATVVANAVSAPDGTLTADKLVENTATSVHTVASGSVSATANGFYNLSFYAKAGERSLLQVNFSNVSLSGNVWDVDLAANTIAFNTSGSGWTNVAGSIADVGNNWRRISISGQVGPTISAVSVTVRLCSAPLTIIYAGDGTSGIYVWGAQLEAGSTASAYQQIVTPAISYLTYQPQPILYEDAAGTTPVTAVEGPVGLMLDKSKGLVLGSEVVVNGEFATDTAWTKGAGWTIGGGQATKTAGASGALEQTLLLTTTKLYKVTYTVSGLTAGTYNLRFGGVNIALGLSNNGTFTRYAYPSFASGSVGIDAGSTFDGSVDNISVKELPGNHAFQTSNPSRPTLSARYNLLTKTEQFNDAAWAKRGALTVAPNDALAPDGTVTADRLDNLGADAINDTFQSFSAVVGVTYTASIYIKRVSTSGTVKLKVFAFETSINLSAIGSDWYRVSVNRAATATTEYFQLFCSAGAPVSVYVWGADLRVSNETAGIPAYQRVNTATDYDTTGFPPYLAFNGVDRWMQTATITPGTDKAQVFAGVRKLGTADGMILESSADAGSNAGAFYVGGPLAGGTWRYAFLSRGTSNSVSFTTDAAYASPITNVLTSLGDISGDSTIIRANGSQVANSTSDQGTGNFLAYPLYIGRRGGTSLPYNGRIYSLITRFGPNLTAAQITATETYVNTKTKAY